MNKLLLNEFKKTGFKKIIIYDLLIISIISIIIYLNRNLNSIDIFNIIYSLIPFLGILICIIFSGIISNEISNGTFRVYLTKGYNRWKILMSKLIFIYLYIIHLYLITFVSYYVIIKIFFVFDIDVNILLEVFKHFVPLFFIGTLCLLLSTIINNSILCVGLTIIICLLSSVIAQILFIFNFNIIQYTFLPYIDFNVLRDSVYLNELRDNYSVYLSINKGVIVLLFHILLCICLSINFFTKKDIKN